MIAPGSGAMFDGIARRYDTLNRVISLGLDQRWRKLLVESVQLPEEGRLLDLATGTADVALMAARRYRNANVVGLDSSPEMLAIARGKVERSGLGARVTLALGDAMKLPFPDRSFDAVTIAFGIRNLPDRPGALREMARVVRAGGRVGILELSIPRRGLLAGLARLHVRHVVPRLGAALSRADDYHYLASSIAAFPVPEHFAALMMDAGLAAVSYRPLAFGAAQLYMGVVA